jgi:hypothetical protein
MELRVRPASSFTAAALQREPTGREGTQSQPEVSDTLKMVTYSLGQAPKLLKKRTRIDKWPARSLMARARAQVLINKP